MASPFSLLLLFASLALAFYIFMRLAVRVVPEHQRLVVFRLGACLGVRGPGRVCLMPLIDRSVTVDLREQDSTLAGTVVATNDNQELAVDMVILYHVVDPVRSLLAVADALQSLRVAAATALTSVASSMTRSEMTAGLSTLGPHVLTRLQALEARWGLAVTCISLREASLARA